MAHGADAGLSDGELPRLGLGHLDHRRQALIGPFMLATKTTGDLPATMTGTKSRVGS